MIPRTNHHHSSGRKAEEHKSSVIENGIKFNIRLDMGSSTGLYLDQRRNRQRLAALFDRIPEHPSGHPKTMLNTFSYTCSFSLFAALKGVRTVNVDASPIAIAIARQNFRDNALDPEQHVFYIKVRELME
jgi:23S rRNA G2069 N7-methylase RlmK/C1962 C5-methylase RlmI